MVVFILDKTIRTFVGGGNSFGGGCISGRGIYSQRILEYDERVKKRQKVIM